MTAESTDHKPYVPRDGDRIRVELTLSKTSGDPGWFAPGFGSIDPGWLINAGVSVELVARAEPDWQPGDIGLDRKTRHAYAYHPGGSGMSDDYPWWPCSPSISAGDPVSRESLAGELERMRLVPEDDERAGRVSE